MSIKEKYRIPDDTWEKIKKAFLLVVFATPFMAGIFSFLTWPIVDGFSWSLVPVVPWALFYFYAIATCIPFLKRSRHTVLIISILILLIAYFFASIGFASIFRLFGKSGLLILLSVLMPASVVVCIRYFKYWEKVWESHRFHNEETVLDLKNGRYDFVRNFDMDESILKKKKQRQYSNPAIMSIIYMIAPLGVGLGMILHRSEQFTFTFALLAALSIPASLGFLKPFAASLLMYRKLSFYEKQIGKPIINGLLE